MPSLKVLDSLWSQVVEEGLLLSSHERKYAALLLLQVLAPQLPRGALIRLLTPNLRRTLVNNLGKKQCLLYTVAHATLAALLQRSSTDGGFAYDLLRVLATEHRNFDKITHTRTMGTLMEHLDEDGKIVMALKAPKRATKPSKSLNKTPLRKNFRRSAKAIQSQTAGKFYRGDLTGKALARYAALHRFTKVQQGLAKKAKTKTGRRGAVGDDDEGMPSLTA